MYWSYSLRQASVYAVMSLYVKKHCHFQFSFISFNRQWFACLHIDTMVLAPIQARKTETIWLRYCCQLVRPQKFRLDKHFCQLNVKHCSKYIFNQSNTVMEISMWTVRCVILQGLQYVLHNTHFLLMMQPFSLDFQCIVSVHTSPTLFLSICKVLCHHCDVLLEVLKDVSHLVQKSCSFQFRGFKVPQECSFAFIQLDQELDD